MREYSGKQINKAGEILVGKSSATDSHQFLDAMDILSYWRMLHIKPLETAFKLLQKISTEKDKKAIFAKRLKRYISIVKKLDRFDSMKLKNMQDIGGCRAILANEKKLRQIIRELKKNPQFKILDESYRTKDYIKSPKEDGYRSYHIIGFFPDSNGDLSKNGTEELNMHVSPNCLLRPLFYLQ